LDGLRVSQGLTPLKSQNSGQRKGLDFVLAWAILNAEGMFSSAAILVLQALWQLGWL